MSHQCLMVCYLGECTWISAIYQQRQQGFIILAPDMPKSLPVLVKHNLLRAVPTTSAVEGLSSRTNVESKLDHLHHHTCCVPVSCGKPELNIVNLGWEKLGATMQREVEVGFAPERQPALLQRHFSLLFFKLLVTVVCTLHSSPSF